jgi:hypothetical protein
VSGVDSEPAPRQAQPSQQGASDSRAVPSNQGSSDQPSRGSSSQPSAPSVPPNQ